MASGFIGNEVPRKGLRVRSPCPPLFKNFLGCGTLLPLSIFIQVEVGLHRGCLMFSTPSADR